MEVTRKSRISYRINFIVFIVLFLVVISMLAWLSNTYNIRSDWTANKRNSLSNETIQLLDGIQGPVKIRSYQTDTPLLKQAISEILQRYQHHKPDLSYKILNPDLDIESAKADKISLYGQTVIEFADKQETINNATENNISNALIRLTRTRKPLIMFTQGHGERDPDNQANTGFSTLKLKLLEKGFDIQSINLISTPIPENINTLVIAAPSHAFHAGEIEQIKQYLNQGGNLLWLHDPGNLLGLEPVAEMFSIRFLKGVVVDDNPTLRKTLRIQHPAVVPVIEYYPHTITEDMRYNTLFPIANAIEFEQQEQWQVTPLLKTMDSSWSETAGFALEVSFEENKGDQAGPHNLGLALQRSVNKKQQRVVVIGDSDFVANTYLGAGANLLLGINVLNWLSEDDNLINIAAKPASDLQLKIGDTGILVIGLSFLVVLPLGLLGCGLFIWFKRRNR